MTVLTPLRSLRSVTLTTSLIATLGMGSVAYSQAVAEAPAVQDAVAQDITSGWAALPAETVACLRMPDTRSFLDALRANTVLGQRVLTEDRIAGFIQLLKDENAEGWTEFETNLESLGLTSEDLNDLIQEPWGAGWVMVPTETRDTPQSTLLFWADLDEDRIDQLEAALDQNEGDQANVQRTDLELGGVTVREYTQAEEGDESLLLVTRLPGRVIVAAGIPELGQMAQAEGADAGQAGIDLEAVHGVLDRYITDTRAGAADIGFAPRMAAVPGVAAATALGRDAATPTAAELFVDLPAIMDTFKTGVAQGVAAGGMNDPESQQQVTAVFEALGLNDLGVLATSAYAGEGGLQFRGFLGASAPRHGLVGMLDGTTLPAAPPAWVPNDVGYAHVAFDLGNLWDLAIDIAQATGGPEGVQQIQQANSMAGMFIQTDIQSALRSLGTAHRIISMPTEIAPGDLAGESVQPTVFVWEPTDAGVLQRIFAFAKQSMGSQPGVELADEQGFSGLRFEQQGASGAALLGPDHMIVGVGGTIIDRLLPLLSAPPAPANAMTGSDVFRDGEALLPYREGFFFQISDGGRDLANTMKQIMTSVMAESSDNPEITQRIADLMPADEDLRAALGSSVAQMYLDEGGVVFEGAVATPAAE